MSNLDEARRILAEYVTPNSLIDSGNLFFAATEYQLEVQWLQRENQRLTKALEVAKGALKSIKKFESMNQHPDHEIRHALIVEVPHEANEALEQIERIEKGE